MAKVSVVIPNYNGEKFLEDCLGSLKAQTYDDFELIIVDNASKDNGREIINRIFPEATLIKLEENYGFSKAVNVGIRVSEAPYIILLNNDTRLEADFVENLVKAIERDNRIFSVSARMLRMDDPGKIDSAGDMYCCLGWAFARGKDRAKEGYDKKEEVFSACAGAAIYRKDLFKETGLFDEKHFAYLEDVDIGYRARINGYINVYEPGAVVYHAGRGISGSRYNRFKIDLSSRNNVYMAYKNMPLIQLLINLPFLFAGTVIKALFFTIKGEGMTYLKGVGKGIVLCDKRKKYPFKRENLINYVRIQLELWRNVFIRFLG
ncbi:MAG: glycosyltransferase family 2 protein [Lachnospiraceae bacterium]|nr:glycosyltransferase family 2 protein [Lachnospiraceae bacterium]